MYDCLEYNVLKAGVETGDTELRGNVGFGFMVSYLLKLKGIVFRLGSEVQPHTYLFRTTIKKSMKDVYESEASVSSSAPLNVVMEKAKARKRKQITRKNLPPLPAPTKESGSDSNEPQLKKAEKIPEPPFEPAVNVQVSTVEVVREIVDQLIERPAILPTEVPTTMVRPDD